VQIDVGCMLGVVAVDRGAVVLGSENKVDGITVAIRGPDVADLAIGRQAE
jgi:hypothetical protein